MKKLNLKILSTAIALLISCFGCSINVFAATSRGITISPTNERIVLTPGETFSSGFRVANPNDAEDDLHYSVSISPFLPVASENSNDDYGRMDYENKTSWSQIVDWTTINNPTGTVHPNNAITINYTIRVPEDAPAGGQYMALIVKEDREASGQSEDSLEIQEVMQMAFIVFAEVAGETREEGEIIENNLPSFVLSNKLSATSIVQNNGNIHTNAEYVLQIWPFFSDEEICTNEENANTETLIPGTKKYHIESCNIPAIGIFRAKQTVKIFGEVATIEKLVIACPIWLLFIIIFAIIIIIFYFIAKSKSRKKK